MPRPSPSAPALAAEPAVVYDLGGKNDKSFNEAAFKGAEKFKADTGTAYREFEIQNDSQREQALRKFARDGNDPIIAIGFSQAQAIETVAKEFPNTHFAIVDSVVDLPNVRSIVFKEQEGSYLVGMLAAMASKTGKVGFVGGMDIPLIRRFACGYVEGVKAVKPDGRDLPEHDRHHRCCLERSGEGRRARQVADRPAAPTSSITPPAAPASACSRPPPMPASSASASIPTRTISIPARC